MFTSKGLQAAKDCSHHTAAVAQTYARFLAGISLIALGDSFQVRPAADADFVHTGTAEPPPLVAAALFGTPQAAGSSRAVWGCIDLGWRDQQGYWVHPAAADSAIHAGAAARLASDTGMMVSVAVGSYAPASTLKGSQRLMRGMPDSDKLAFCTMSDLCKEHTCTSSLHAMFVTGFCLSSKG